MYGYEIWFEGNCVADSDNFEGEYETSYEAEEEANEEVYYLMDEYGDADFDDFEIVIKTL